MVTAIRAIYENGHLRLLDPVNLSEGEEVQLTILTEVDRVRAALGDLLMEVSAPEDDEDIDEEALMRELDEAFRGQPPISEDIIKERREGP
jgi:predicted DNA-binding antitoxin AbrB/MazE fold protein